jgi:hypothetical protein
MQHPGHTGGIRKVAATNQFIPGNHVRATFVILSLTLLTACGGTPARQSGPVTGTAAMAGMMARIELPVHALIGHRERLGLSSQQVTALDSIGHALDRRNAPLLQELPRAGERTRTPLDTTVLVRLRDHRAEAAEAVREILSEQQRVEVCEIYRDRRARPGHTPRQRRAPDDVGGAGAFAGRPWPWCDRQD